jgi:peptidoglycan/LPS O-acetylase OafA/YrhL
MIKPLTSIRFFAAAIVVVYHSGAAFASTSTVVPGFAKTFLLNGHVGVTFFFVLSGFILHHTYRRKLAGSDALRKFAVSRIARIYPVYLLTLLAMIPFTPSAMSWADMPQFLAIQWWITGPTAFLGNWNGPSWTVSLELAFYLAFPWLTSGAMRASSRQLAAVLVALFIFDLVTASSTFVPTHAPRFAWMVWVPAPLIRIPEFIVGIIAAEFHFRRSGKKPNVPAWVFAIVLLLVMSVSSDLWVGTAVTFLTAFMISAIAGDRGSLFTRVLENPVIVLLGAASYSLYLVQQPVHFATVAIVGTSKVMVALQYPAMLAISVLIFIYFEEPMREWIRLKFKIKPSAIEEVSHEYSFTRGPKT